MDQDTLIAADYNVRAWGVSGTRDGYVYITASNWADVGVYSADGAFLHRLHIDPPAGGGGVFYNGAVSLSQTEDLIAFSTWQETTPIAVYKTH